jgi:hypothetical protein
VKWRPATPSPRREAEPELSARSRGRSPFDCRRALLSLRGMFGSPASGAPARVPSR